MTIQVWAGANPNPSSGFLTQGRRCREGKGCHSISQRYNSQWQTSKTPELLSADLRPCNVLALLFHNFSSEVFVTYCIGRGREDNSHDRSMTQNISQTIQLQEGDHI